MKERMRKAFTVLRGQEKPAVLDFAAATSIYHELGGAQLNGQSKEVSMAILKTAEKLGAKVTIHEEGKSAIDSLGQGIEISRSNHEHFVNRKKANIEDLRRQMDEEQTAIDRATAHSSATVTAKRQEIAKSKEVLKFFTA